MAFFSSAVNRLTAPFFRSPISRGPIDTRTRRNYSNPLRFEQTPNLPVLAFVQHNLQPAILIAAPQ
jgi:hypothetical protein